MIIISLKNLFVKQNFKNTLIKEGHHVSKFGFYFSASICIAFENRMMMNLKFFLSSQTLVMFTVFILNSERSLSIEEDGPDSERPLLQLTQLSVQIPVYLFIFQTQQFSTECKESNSGLESIYTISGLHLTHYKAE